MGAQRSKKEGMQCVCVGGGWLWSWSSRETEKEGDCEEENGTEEGETVQRLGE